MNLEYYCFIHFFCGERTGFNKKNIGPCFDLSFETRRIRILDAAHIYLCPKMTTVTNTGGLFVVSELNKPHVGCKFMQIS